MGAPLVRHYGEQGSTSDGGSPVKVGDYTARFVHSDDAKHRDTPVPLDTFKCQSIERSSFIKRICFDATNSYMIVLLNETYYQLLPDRQAYGGRVHGSRILWGAFSMPQSKAISIVEPATFPFIERWRAASRHVSVEDTSSLSFRQFSRLKTSAGLNKSPTRM